MYSLDQPKTITRATLPKLESVLGYQINCPDSFFAPTESSRDFDDFFREVLVEHSNRAIWLDWKLDPETLFWYLNKLFPHHSFNLVSSEERLQNLELIGYQVKYTYDSEIIIDFIRVEELPQFMEKINENIRRDDGIQLVQYDADIDSYKWFLAKLNFDRASFLELVDTYTKPIPVRIKIPHLRPDDIQNEKSIYVPFFHINDRDEAAFECQQLKDGDWQSVAYASKIVSGQSLRQAIRQDLEKDFNYRDDFEIGKIRYDDRVNDKQGVPTPRFYVCVAILGSLDVNLIPHRENTRIVEK